MNRGRRKFIYALGGAGLCAAAANVLRPGKGASTGHDGQPIDFHVHLFGIGDGATGCWFSERQKQHLNYRYLRKLVGVESEGSFDEAYVERLVAQLKASSIRRAVLQAWDCRYDGNGEPDWERTTSVYVPNSYLLKVTARHPHLFVPCASINPKRKDAFEELDRCAAGGARVVKIHPPTMDVDPADPRYRKFFGRCADRRMIVMVHTGTEHSADTVGDEFGDPRRLTQALEEGCTVIAAHAGMNAFFDRLDFSMNLRPMIRRYRNLYFDTAVLGSMFRWRNLPGLMEDSEVMERAIHGSDFPFPSNALVFWNRIAPSKLAGLLSERNLFERDYRLKLALGLPPEAFERAAGLLAEARKPVPGS